MVRHGEMEVSGVVRFLHGSTILKTDPSFPRQVEREIHATQS